MARYGVSRYGIGLYGDQGSGVECIESGYCFPYDRFVLSGVNLGLYTFELNPIRYDPFRQFQTRVYDVVMSTNPTVDEDYRKIPIEISWDFMPQRMWDAILPYARKRRDGSSEDIYFWDGAISGLQGTRIRIENLKGEVRGGYNPVHRFNVSMTIRIATA